MSSEVIIALIGIAGSAIGTFGGVLTSTRLIAYRIEQLEKKVEKHNGVIERMFILEGRMQKAENDISDLEERKK